MGGNGAVPPGGTEVLLISAVNVKPIVLLEPELSAGVAFLFTTMSGERLPALAFPLAHGRMGGALADLMKVAVKEAMVMLGEHQAAAARVVEVEAAPVVVACAVCGVRIFGAVAERGSCESCFASLPPAEVKPTLLGGEG